MTEWDNIKVRDLQRFAAVIEAGGFTAGAAAMDESPKQLSRRIAILEEILGTHLFHRTTRSVTPTVEGSSWYADVRGALDRLQEATEALGTPRALQGLVRVQVPTLFVDELLGWTTAQMDAHPGLAFDLLVGDRSDDLLGRGIDVCLSGVPPSGATLRVRTIGTASPILAAHRRYLQAHGAPEAPEDLANHECLRFATSSPQATWRLTHETGRLATVPVGGRFACNDSRVLLRALTMGIGIGPLTGEAQAQLASGELRPVLPAWRFGAVPMYLALAPGRKRLARVRHVADALVRMTEATLAAFEGPAGPQASP